MLVRPVIGRLCDFEKIQAHSLFQIAAVAEGIATLLLPLAKRYIYFVLYFLLYGCTDGAMFSAMCVACMFCFKGVSVIVGLVSTRVLQISYLRLVQLSEVCIEYRLNLNLNLNSSEN